MLGIFCLYLCFFVLASPHGLWYLSSTRPPRPPPGMEPVHPAVEARNPNHWTAREFPMLLLVWGTHPNTSLHLPHWKGMEAGLTLWATLMES